MRTTGASVCVSERVYDAAVAFYKSSLNARVVGARTTSFVTLESAVGFRVTVHRAARGGGGDRVRLPALAGAGARIGDTVPAARLAYALGAGGKVKHSRKGLAVTDRYGVRWMVA